MENENKKMVIHKLSIINNDIKIMKDTIFDMKMEMNEMKKLIMQIIACHENNKEKISKGWFWE